MPNLIAKTKTEKEFRNKQTYPEFTDNDNSSSTSISKFNQRKKPTQGAALYYITPTESTRFVTQFIISGDDAISTEIKGSFSLGGDSEEIFDKINNDRIQLLAKKYAKKYFSIEDDARLAIVTQHIRQLVPRFTIEDFEALNDIANEIKRIEEKDKKLRLELDL